MNQAITDIKTHLHFEAERVECMEGLQATCSEVHMIKYIIALTSL